MTNGSSPANGPGTRGGESALSPAFEWLASDGAGVGPELEFEFEFESDSELESQLEPEVTPTTLRRGSRGPAVTDLQTRLLAAGYDPRGVDGIFGQDTESAVRAFQRAEGLVVDGIVGPHTWNRLLADSPVVVPPYGPPWNTDWSSLSADQRMRYVMDILVNRYGFPVNGAAGVVGNLYAESALLPNRIEGSDLLTPMRAESFSGVPTTFTAQQIMNRSLSQRTGPLLAGTGLAQWTTTSRRVGLFRHAFDGRVLGANILFDMDAQLDYLVHELGTSYRAVSAVITNPSVTVDAASDEITLRFERPGWSFQLPPTHPTYLKNLAGRRRSSQQARQVFLAP